MVSFLLILYNHDQQLTLKDPPFFAEATSSAIVQGPLGKSIIIMILDMVALQSVSNCEIKSNSFAVSTNTVCIPFSGFGFFLLSLCSLFWSK